MHKLLSRIFESLDERKIRYCLMRDGHEIELLTDGGEVDMLVEPRKLRQFGKLVASLGFIELPGWGHQPHRFYVAYDAESDTWLKLDVVTKVAFGRPIHHLHTNLAKSCLQNRQRSGATYIPSVDDEFLSLLLHCVVDKNYIREERGERLQWLASHLDDMRYVEKVLKRYWSSGMSLGELTAVIARGDWTRLLAERAAVVERLEATNPLGELRRQRDRVLRRLNHWAGWWLPLRGPRAMSIALLAPDGAGKSTLAMGIEDSFFFPVRLVYMGLYQNESKRKKKRGIPGFGLFGRIAKQWRQYAMARYHQARGKLIIFDRYSYDALLTPRQKIGRLRQMRRSLLGKSCPAPNMVLFLDAPGEKLYARKGEHTPEILEAQRQNYLALQDQVPNMVVVDVDRDPDVVRRDVMQLIWRGYVGA
ncbi:MAG: hypothetical protein AAF614_32200 [Chloroflexota bacterium]